MNNEEKILALLESMDTRLGKLEAGQAKLEAGQAKLEADVTDLRTEMNERFDSVDFSIKEILKDLGHAEDRLDLHESAIKKIM